MTVLSLARSTRGGWTAPILRVAFLATLGLVTGACAEPGPVPLTMGETDCDHCHMTLMDQRFGAELVSATGKVYVFDAIECMASFALEFPDEVHSLWVTNFRAPSQFVRVEDAFFVKSDLLKSPMGMGLIAFGEGMTPEGALNSFGGEILDWSGVLDLARRGSGAHHDHGAPESVALR